MQVKVVNGRVELRKKNGILIRVVGYSNAVYAELHPSKNILLIITETGKLELRNTEGSVIKEISSSGAREARFKEDMVIFQTQKGDWAEHSIN